GKYRLLVPDEEPGIRIERNDLGELFRNVVRSGPFKKEHITTFYRTEEHSGLDVGASCRWSDESGDHRFYMNGKTIKSSEQLYISRGSLFVYIAGTIHFFGYLEKESPKDFKMNALRVEVGGKRSLLFIFPNWMKLWVNKTLETSNHSINRSVMVIPSLESDKFVKLGDILVKSETGFITFLRPMREEDGSLMLAGNAFFDGDRKGYRWAYHRNIPDRSAVVVFPSLSSINVNPYVFSDVFTDDWM
ncbi:MAG: hypothetical protein WAX66_02045, partial [Patescibacteria group bacterium]